ncbi:MAG: hypothetical protein MZV65_25340 [Chromatiales bacterium]|nr:hypothetical protein [Chromatiales bacterium]
MADPGVEAVQRQIGGVDPVAQGDGLFQRPVAVGVIGIPERAAALLESGQQVGTGGPGFETAAQAMNEKFLEGRKGIGSLDPFRVLQRIQLRGDVQFGFHEDGGAEREAVRRAILPALEKDLGMGVEGHASVEGVGPTEQRGGEIPQRGLLVPVGEGLADHLPERFYQFGRAEIFLDRIEFKQAAPFAPGGRGAGGVRG